MGPWETITADRWYRGASRGFPNPPAAAPLVAMASNANFPEVRKIPSGTPILRNGRW